MSTTIGTLQETISITNRQFEASFVSGDGAAAAAVYSRSGQAFPPNAPMISGRDNLRNLWQAVMDSGVKKVTLETLELEPCGEFAFEVGKATLSGEGDAVLDVVKFVVVWQQENGAWKWHRDIWNSIGSA